MKNPVKILVLALIVVLSAVLTVDAVAKQKKSTKSRQPAKTAVVKESRSSATVKQEQLKTRKEIDETKKRISANESQTRTQLNRLDEINGQISAQEATINSLKTRIDEMEERRVAVTDTIESIKRNVAVLKKELAKSLREGRARRHQINTLGFLFSSKSFGQASRRLHYLRQLDKARNRRIEELRAMTDTLAAREAELSQLVSRHNNAVTELAAAKSVLDSRKAESKKVVDQLKDEQTVLNRILAEKRAYAKRLDDELDRIIAEEARRKKEEDRKRREQSKPAPAKPSKPGATQPVKPSEPERQQAQNEADADRELTGSFVANKGRLLFPVAGKYTIVSRFGRSNYDDLNNVEVNNSGIDISVAPGTPVRAVFDGEVSSVFFLNGYENVVIVRHGEYLTVYAGLANISVTKGAKVKSGQTLGAVATVNGRSVLHFEVRKERTKLNPLDWVR